MRKLFVFLCVVFFHLAIVAKQAGGPNFISLIALKVNAKFIQTDNLGNLYVVTQTNQLNKYGRNGKLLGTLNYNYTGSITQIDASNPMQIFVFYRELNKVIYIDNNMAYRGEIDLNKANIIQATSIARAYDNNLWVFDLGDLQLKKINDKNVVEQTSGNVRQYVSNDVAVCGVHDNNDRVFVIDSINGILLFDVFGSYLKTLPIKGISEVKVSTKNIYYYHNGNINQYNWQTSLGISFSMPDTTRVQKMSIEKERLYIQKSDSIYIYSF
jgi:hypothetical protein